MQKPPKPNPSSPSFNLQQNKFYGLELAQLILQWGEGLEGCRGYNTYLFLFPCPWSVKEMKVIPNEGTQDIKEMYP